MKEPVQWTDDGHPRSPRFDDVYRSRSGGLAQARGVFLAGCQLPEGWRGRKEFSVLETGFGLGLNFLATWAAWEADAQRCERLHFASVEAYPVAAADILRGAQMLSPAGDEEASLVERVQVLAGELAQAWQDLAPGIQQRQFADGRLRLTLAVGDVLPMLEALPCEADAVFLDGFSPARNPDMWSMATLQAVARHCRPGATLASYTVAQQVRERLSELGFSVHKRPGLPPKRHRLQACRIAAPADRPQL